MADSVGNQNANDRSGDGDNNSRHNESSGNPSATPTSQQTQGNSDDNQSTCYYCRKESSFGITTVVEILVGIALVVVGGLQYAVYTRQANIMEIEQRPWISLESVKIIGPLTFDTAGANLSLSYQIKNVGHSPAFDTIFYPVITPIWLGANGNMIIPNVTNDKTAPLPSKFTMSDANKILCEQAFTLADLKEQIRNLDEQRRGQHIGFDFVSSGNVILPDKTFDGEFGNTQKNTVHATARPDSAKFYALGLAACVRYIDPQSGGVHFTPSGYLISGIETPLPFDQKPVPADRLRLQLGGLYAD